MRNLMIGGALGAMALASPATAGMSPDLQHDLETAFASRGDCQVPLQWAHYNYKRWKTQVEGLDAGPVMEELHATFECQRLGRKWFIVQTNG